jgi:hypothetical protein
MTCTNPVSLAERDGDRRSQRGAARQKGLGHLDAPFAHAAVERLAVRLRGIAALVGIEAELEQHRQHLRPIDLNGECHQPAVGRHTIGERALSVPSACRARSQSALLAATAQSGVRSAPC